MTEHRHKKMCEKLRAEIIRFGVDGMAVMTPRNPDGPEAAAAIDELHAENARLREALDGYRAATSFIAADAWDGCRDCIDVLRAARAADYTKEATANETALHLARIRKHYSPSLEAPSHD